MTTAPDLQRNIAKAKRARAARKRMIEALGPSHTIAAIARKRETDPRPSLKSLLTQPLPQNRGGNSA